MHSHDDFAVRSFNSNPSSEGGQDLNAYLRAIAHHPDISRFVVHSRERLITPALDDHTVANVSNEKKTLENKRLCEHFLKTLTKKYPEGVINRIFSQRGTDFLLSKKSGVSPWSASEIREIIVDAEIANAHIPSPHVVAIVETPSIHNTIASSLLPSGITTEQALTALVGLLAAGAAIPLLHPAALAHSLAVASLLGTATAGHLSAAAAIAPGVTTAITGAANTAIAAAPTLQVTANTIAGAIVPIIVVGVGAHRAEEALRALELETTSLATGIVSAALATHPAILSGHLATAIVAAAITGHLVIDEAVIRRAFSILGTGAAAAMAAAHPEVVINLAHQITTAISSYYATATASTTQTSALSAALIPHSIMTPAAITKATTTATTAITHSGTALAATAAHGINLGTATMMTAIAAHPLVVTTALIAGACMTAQRWIESPQEVVTATENTANPPSSSTQTATSRSNIERPVWRRGI
ncbi:MAG: hypothetical protein A3F67_09295 [Verrucomicrobia bacterium RIFCSPHIGHO2_12_FULL_41_10]|nr:MAG: hypothetical protein A3F67_09295 [Verrucomicrobia bacterium RIFCSPHIGHO2_12_FULL_41_10]HLB32961.1 hypothetical protein [Chthoniobacterales bacterium]